MNQNKTKLAKEVSVCGILIALTFVATFALRVPMPVGYIHMGDTVIFVTALTLGARRAAISGAVGMALTDILLGFPYWAPFTVMICVGMAFIIWLFMRDKTEFSVPRTILALSTASTLVIIGYYIAQALIYSSTPNNWTVPALSIAGNLLQVVVGIVLAVPIAFRLKKIDAVKKIR